MTPTGKLPFGTEAMADVRSEFRALRRLVDQAGALMDPTAAPALERITENLNAFCPSISFVGQVKAGKTALVNVLAGRPGLLPSDVNPWTSVVTSLNINKPHDANLGAEFTFYDHAAWEDLVQGGGRLGQIAARVGAQEELDEIRRQIESVRAKSKERLGRNFELLLGKKHKFDSFDRELIERYVCLGDPDDPEVAKQGRFADITRSAELYMHLAQYPIAMTLQDTPGVNDPFLMREQVTLRSLHETAVSVVVLSATQALNTVDLGLVQLLASTGDKQLMIFVNRIDELDDPATQVGEIRWSLDETLRRYGVAGSKRIWFGSAIWAQAALTGTIENLPIDCLEALEKWSSIRQVDDCPDIESAAWSLSGVPSFQEGLGGVIRESVAQNTLEAARIDLRNLVSRSMIENRTAMKIANGSARIALGREQIENSLGVLHDRLKERLHSEVVHLRADATRSIQKVAEQYVEETVARITGKEDVPREEGVECDSIQLRAQLRSACLRFATDVENVRAAVFGKACEGLQSVLNQILGDISREVIIEHPRTEQFPVPASLGRTIVVDLKTPWFRRWLSLQFGGTAVIEARVRAVLRTEVEVIVGDICGGMMEGMVAQVEQALEAFMADQSKAILKLANADEAARMEHLAALGLKERVALLKDAAEKAKKLMALADLLAAEDQSELRNAN